MTTIQVEQLLHGYRNGHRLLAGSVMLDPNSAREVNLLSDLSGASLTVNFDEYLTGYPLEGARRYVFARTWYAREMARPGSVWTHSLLIKFADIGKLEHLAVLWEQFARPGDPFEDFQRYTSPLSVEMMPRERYRVVPYPRQLAEFVIRSLYCSEAPVLVPTEGPGDAEALALDVWAQQWPKLRRNFSFCTGAIEPRTLRQRPLDLQFVPFGRATRSSVERVGVSRAPLWVERVVDDVPVSGRTELRWFLWRFGADLGGSRASFRQLAEVFEFSKAVGPTANTTQRALELLPNGEEGAALKAFLLREAAAADPLGTLNLLVARGDLSLFDPGEAILSEVLRRSLYQGAHAVVEALTASESAPWGVGSEGRRRAVVEALPSSALIQLLRQKGWTEEIAVARPQLAGELEFWRAVEPTVREHFLQTVSQLPDARRLWRELVLRLGSGPAENIEQLLRFGRDGVVSALLDLVNVSGYWENPPDWTSTLAEWHAAALTWLSCTGTPRAGARGILAEILSPGDPRVRALGLEPWRGGFDERDVLARTPSGQAQLAFLFRLQVAAPELTSAVELHGVFQSLYSTAAKGGLHERARSLIYEVRPKGGNAAAWDHCDQLRRLLLDRAERGDIDWAFVTDCIPDFPGRVHAAEYAVANLSGFSLGQFMMSEATRFLSLSQPKPQKKANRPGKRGRRRGS